MKLIKRIQIFLLLVILAYSFCSESATESADQISNKINISEGNMKHRKSHMRSHNTDKLYTSNLAGDQTAIDPASKMTPSNKNLDANSDLMKLAGVKGSDSQPGQEEIKLGPGPIFFTGWMKYFQYSTKELSKAATPKHFFKNLHFHEQKRMLPQADLNATSSDGVNDVKTYIPSASFFYVVLFKDNVNFLSSRQIQLQKTYDTLSLEKINAVEETRGFGSGNPKSNRNGIQDFGNFSEGFCLKVLARDETWIICLDSEEKKNKFMIILKQLKLNIQRHNGQFVLAAKKTSPNGTISALINKKPQPPGNSKNSQKKDGKDGKSCEDNKKLTDGYWIILQSWSQCSLKCGGGTSTLQRMCVPPKNGGAPCEGQAVMTKSCNTNPCPASNSSDKLCGNAKDSNNTIILKPEIKVMVFSTRPQRYSKCIIKESDLMMTKEPENEGQPDNPFQKDGPVFPGYQMPVRVVMNNKTITVFTGESYDSHINSFNIKDANFKRSIKNKSCFYITEGKKNVEFCPFSGNNPAAGRVVDEWDYDFNLFKHQCASPREKITIALDKKLKQKLDKKLADAREGILAERENEIKKNVVKQEEAQLQSVIKNTNKVALQAIQKEINLEALIRQEEADREARDEQDMMKSIEIEKHKSECLMKAIKEKEIENQYNLKAKEAEDEVSSIKKSATQQVLTRRSQLKTQIMQMRKKAQMRKNKLAQELMKVRTVMAETMGKAYKKGDAAKCQKAMQSNDEKTKYCQANFFDSYSDMENCKEGDDFCTLCCEKEFGELHLKERKTCFSTICPHIPRSSDGLTALPITPTLPGPEPTGDLKPPQSPDKPAPPGTENTTGGSWIWHNVMT